MGAVFTMTLDGLDPDTALVEGSNARGLKRETIRKTISPLAMILDHGEVAANPARGVNLPEHDAEEVNPPTASHVEAVYRLMPKAYRLATIALDQTGMRVGELEKLTWGDVDEQAGRWRVGRLSAKTRKARWVPVPTEVFVEVLALKPREDRHPTAQVFDGFLATAYRTSLTRACKAAGVPSFSPHDLRHRRATLWHLDRVPAAEAASWLGHSAHEHLHTYAHVLLDRGEINLSAMLDADQVRHTAGHTPAGESRLVAGQT
jgi:integrase